MILRMIIIQDGFHHYVKIHVGKWCMSCVVGLVSYFWRLYFVLYLHYTCTYDNRICLDCGGCGVDWSAAWPACSWGCWRWVMGALPFSVLWPGRSPVSYFYMLQFCFCFLCFFVMFLFWFIFDSMIVNLWKPIKHIKKKKKKRMIIIIVIIIILIMIK